MSTVSKTVLDRGLELLWGTYPMVLAISCLVKLSMSLPSRNMLPLGLRMPSMHLMSVVFPEPLGPIRLKIS